MSFLFNPFRRRARPEVVESSPPDEVALAQARNASRNRLAGIIRSTQLSQQQLGELANAGAGTDPFPEIRASRAVGTDPFPEIRASRTVDPIGVDDINFVERSSPFLGVGASNIKRERLSPVFGVGASNIKREFPAANVPGSLSRVPSRSLAPRASPIKYESPIEGGLGITAGLIGSRAVSAPKARPPSRLDVTRRTPAAQYAYVGTMGPTSQPPAYPVPTRVFPSTFGPVVVPDDGSTVQRRRRRPRAVGWSYRSPPRRQSYRKKLATRRRCRDVLGRFVRC